MEDNQENLIIREASAVEIADDRTFKGIAMPWNEVAHIREDSGVEYNEKFAPGSIVTSNDHVMLYDRHKEPVGKVTAFSDTEAGWYVEGKISKTRAGDDAYELVRDGVVKGLSVGFSREGLEDTFDESTNTITRSKALVKEVSFVPLPAFAGAQILDVRESTSPINTPMKEVEMSEEISEIQRLSDELLDVRESTQRDIATAMESLKTSVAPAVEDHRSAGEALKAIAEGDELLTRAYTGAVLADGIAVPFHKELTRIVDEAATLRNVFAKDSLPANEMTVTYAQLKTPMADAAVQAAEGDDLTYLEIQTETKTVAIKTVGGYSQLSRQLIERSTAQYLNQVLTAQAIAVGKALNTLTRTAFVAAHTANSANTIDINVFDGYAGWLDGIVDGAIEFETLGLSFDALVCDATTFKSLNAVTASDGRPLFVVNPGNSGINTVGSINPSALSGDLAGIKVVVDAGLSAGTAAFVNSRALTTWNDKVTRLQDSNIINLSEDFSLYTYFAVGATIPTGIIPLTLDITSS